MYGELSRAGQVGGTAGSGLGSPQNMPTERSPLVTEAMLAHEALMQDLDNAVNQLERRLAPALRPTQPSPSNPGADKQQEHPVHLVAVVHRNSNRLQFQINRIGDLLDRLEI
jgi:hypothetical protein